MPGIANCLTMLRSNLVSSLDFLHVPAVDYLFQDALVQKIFNIIFRDLRITQSDDFLHSSQALYAGKRICCQIVEKIFVSYLRERPVCFDMFLQNGEASFFLSTHDGAGLDQRLDKL